jgi:hypothetical protein
MTRPMEHRSERGYDLDASSTASDHSCMHSSTPAAELVRNIGCVPRRLINSNIPHRNFPSSTFYVTGQPSVAVMVLAAFLQLDPAAVD